MPGTGGNTILEDEAVSRAYIGQMWAEAMEIYKSSRWKLTFGPEMVRHLKEYQRDFIQEKDYFCQVTHRTWDTILHDIRKSHEGDTDSAPDGSTSLKLTKNVQRALIFPGTYLDVFCAVFLYVSAYPVRKTDRTGAQDSEKYYEKISDI